MRASDPYGRSLLYRFAEWAACAGLHYSRLDHRLGALHQRGGGAAAILMYHRVYAEGSGTGWQLEQQHFAAQIAHLRERYQVLPLDVVVDALTRERPLPPRAVAVTFDDGYRDNYTQALPVLRAFGCPATIFLTAGYIGTAKTMWWDKLSYILRTTQLERPEVEHLLAARHGLPAPDWQAGNAEGLVLVLKRVPEAEKQGFVDLIAADLGVDPEANADDRMMSWGEAQEMIASGFVTMGAHAVTHRNLKHLPLADAQREIVDSKVILERELGQTIDFFAYPFGNPTNDFTDEVKWAVREAGYRAAFTVVLGLARAGCDLYALPRFCESYERWQAPTGRFSRALFDTYLSGARDRLGAFKPGGRRPPVSGERV